VSLAFGNNFGLEAALADAEFLAPSGANSSIFDTEFASLIGTDDFIFGDDVKMSASEMMNGSLFENFSRSGAVALSNSNHSEIQVKIQDKKSAIPASPSVSFLDTVSLNMNAGQDMDFKLFDTIATPKVRDADIDDDDTKDLMMDHHTTSADFEGMFDS